MTNDVVNALQKFLKTFAEEGLSKTVEEKVSEAAAQIKAVSELLSEVNQTTIEDPTYVLQGLTKCSVTEFTGTFELMLNKERITHMAMPVLLVNNSSNNLKRVLNIIHLANSSYHSLNTSNAWNVPQGKHGNHADYNPHHTTTCLNCGNPHMIPDCKRPRNEAKIVLNRKAYMDKRADGPPRNGGRNNWTKVGHGDGPNMSHGSRVQLMGNKWM